MKDIDRRTFLEAAAVFPLASLVVQQAPQSSGHGIRVEHGLDRLDAPRTIAGANVVTYKVATQDTHGGLFLLEQVSMRKGDSLPARGKNGNLLSGSGEASRLCC